MLSYGKCLILFFMLDVVVGIVVGVVVGVVVVVMVDVVLDVVLGFGVIIVVVGYLVNFGGLCGYLGFRRVVVG